MHGDKGYTKRALETYGGSSISLHLIIDQFMHVRTCPEAGERATWKEQL